MTTRPTLYVKGTFNGWGLDTPLLETDNGTLRAELVLSPDNHQFKIADQNGSDQWTLSAHTTQQTDLQLDQPQPLTQAQGIGNDLLFKPEATGRFTIELTVNGQMSLRLTQSTANGSEQRQRLQNALSGQSPQIKEFKSAPHALNVQELFSAIEISQVEPFKYVFGDNIDGYYEGSSHSFASGRYRHHQGWYLGSFASFVDGKLNDKTKAKRAKLQAYGLEHHFDHTVERLAIPANHRCAMLTVQSEVSAQLSLLPELNIALAHSSVEVVDGVVLYTIDAALCPEGCPSVVALSANEPVTVEEITAEQAAQQAGELNLSASNVALQVTTQQASKELTLYLCFENSRDVAIKQAKQAREQALVAQFKQQQYDFLVRNYLWTNDIEYNRALMWARLASRMFVSHEFGTGIWAGLPWFKDCWGRDTFIALPGVSLINGELEEAKAIIENFALMQLNDKSSPNHGRIPNRVTSKTNIIYNTTDGTPWMIREIMEYINYSGDMDFASTMYPVMQRFIEGVELNYLDQDGLLKHRHPDTWMDAKIAGQVPWSPRGAKANDIQALWFQALHCGAQLAQLSGDKANAEHWLALAEKAKASFTEAFWNKDTLQLADRVDESGIADFSLRPNQLMTLTIPTQPLIDKQHGQHMVKQCVDGLLFPWGICSLEQSHADFHPYHDNRDEYHKDAAYHNGTIWGWNAGFTIGALLQYQQTPLAYSLTKNLAKQILEQGHLGTMSENLDAYQPNPQQLVETGTFSQAWSVSEYARNAQQDYLGFTPQLSDNRVVLKPKLPTQWQSFNARLPFGKGSALFVSLVKDAGAVSYSISCENPPKGLQLVVELEQSGQLLTLNCDTEQTPLLDCRFTFNSGWDVNIEPKYWQVDEVESYPLLDGLSFAQPDLTLNHNALQNKDYLLYKRESEQHSIAKD